MLKKEYEEPTIELIVFKTEDVITTSGDPTVGPSPGESNEGGDWES